MSEHARVTANPATVPQVGERRGGGSCKEPPVRLFEPCRASLDKNNWYHPYKQYLSYNDISHCGEANKVNRITYISKCDTNASVARSYCWNCSSSSRKACSVLASSLNDFWGRVLQRKYIPPKMAPSQAKACVLAHDPAMVDPFDK